MLRRSRQTSEHTSLKNEAGFTLLEIIITTALVGLAAITFATMFRSTFFNFINLQTDADTSVNLSTQSNRLGMVIRGATGITNANSDDLTIYAYFYPSDTYVSLLRYYVRTQDGVKQVVADLTPMTANPPIGTPITVQKRTFIIIDRYYQTPDVTLFTYLDASGTSLPTPIADLQSIKGVRVALAAKAANGSNQVQTIQVSLRNRKTNL